MVFNLFMYMLWQHDFMKLSCQLSLTDGGRPGPGHTRHHHSKRNNLDISKTQVSWWTFPPSGHLPQKQLLLLFMFILVSSITKHVAETLNIWVPYGLWVSPVLFESLSLFQFNFHLLDFTSIASLFYVAHRNLFPIFHSGPGHGFSSCMGCWNCL